MAKKRTKLEITRDILIVLKKSRKIRVTRLVHKSNLTNNTIKPYLRNLKENELIETYEKDGNKYYQIKEKGREFLREFNKIKILSESYGI